jgi:hypothetical protein
LSQANGYFERDGLNELGMTWDARIARYLDSPLTGENVAWGQGSYDSPAGIVSQWMHSPTHRATILNAGLHRFGLGLALGSFKGSAKNAPHVRSRHCHRARSAWAEAQRASWRVHFRKLRDSADPAALTLAWAAAGELDGASKVGRHSSRTRSALKAARFTWSSVARWPFALGSGTSVHPHMNPTRATTAQQERP